MSYRQWVAYLMERDELEYSGGVDWCALARGSVASDDATPPVCAARDRSRRVPVPVDLAVI